MNTFAGIVAVLAALVLAWRGWQDHRIGARTGLRYGVIWLMLIVGLALLLHMGGI